jgi:putative flippase GtrA
MILKFLKFGVVGFSGMVIDFLVTFLLKEKLGIHRYIASSSGFIVAATSNYILNRIWTFQSTSEGIALEYGSFIMVSVIGLGINNLFLFLFERRLNFWVAKFFAIVVTVLWNFLANYYFTFKV